MQRRATFNHMERDVWPGNMEEKCIVNCLIKRVNVCWDYKVHVDFNIGFEQVSMSLGIASIAA